MMRRLVSVMRHRDRGSSGLVTAAVILPLLLAAGLVWDASIKLSAGRTAQTIAQEAARVGAQRLTPNAIQGATPDVEPGAAVAAAQDYLAAVGATGSAAVDGDSVTVTVTKSWQPQFLPGGGSVTATATVRTDRG